jgi:hypothetical protein
MLRPSAARGYRRGPPPPRRAAIGGFIGGAYILAVYGGAIEWFSSVVLYRRRSRLKLRRWPSRLSDEPLGGGAPR